ncbi:hypothetical protein AHAS_Ahas08G0095400 [Arachis hypogaea]
MATVSIVFSLLILISLLSIFVSQNFSYLSLASTTSTFFLLLLSIALCKITMLSLPITCRPSRSSIVKLTSLTCISPPDFPQHVTFTAHCAPPSSTPTAYTTSASPVSQCRRADTALRLDRLAARFRLGSIRIQLSSRFSWTCLSQSSSSSLLANFNGVGTVSLGSSISIQRGEQRNHPFWVSVRWTREKTGLPL